MQYVALISYSRGHSSFVNSVFFSKSGDEVISGSSDGTIRLWDISTSDCIASFRCDRLQFTKHNVKFFVVRPNLSSAEGAGREVTVHTVVGMPNNSELIVVGVKGPRAYVMNIRGQTVRTLYSGKATGADFLCLTVSPQG